MPTEAQQNSSQSHDAAASENGERAASTFESTPLDFGVFVPQGWRLDLVGVPAERQWATMLDIARRAEAGPFTSVWVYDHFHTTPHATDEATHEAWTLMAALAAATETVRLGQMCTCIGYRNPALLAKIAATVDVISGGRLEFGIGAGWYEHEWRAYNYGFPGTGERLGMLRDGVQIIQHLWAEGRATLHGEFSSVQGAIVQPQPLQRGRDGRPRIPTWIAGGGEQRTLRYAAKWADRTNFGGTPEQFARKLAILGEHCERFGRDVAEITPSTNLNVIVRETEAEAKAAADRVNAIQQPLMPADNTALIPPGSTPGWVVGTPEQVAERLIGLRDAGARSFICYQPDLAWEPEGLDVYAERVIPLVRAA